MTNEELAGHVRAVRDIMANPDRVVLHADSVYEDADGYEVDDEDACRFCMWGAVMHVVPGVDCQDDIVILLGREAGGAKTPVGNMTEALRRGEHVQVCDRALAALEATP